MISILTTAKPFKGRARKAQMNALKSWKALKCNPEVILCGEGEGYAEAADELGLVRITDVECTERGTPRVDSMFSLAQERGRYDLQAYVNCDIILLDDFVKAACRIALNRFLMVGQRYDIDVEEEIDFDDANWEEKLREKVRPERLHSPLGADYFLYRRGTWAGLPPLIVGRAGYDNWLIYHCRLNGIEVVDATEVTTVIHQNHDYGHLAGGKDEAYRGDEAEINLSLSEGYDSLFFITDADMLLTRDGLVKNYNAGLNRRIETFLVLRKKITLARMGLYCFRVGRHIMFRMGRRGQ